MELADLDQFAATPFDDTYPPGLRVLYSPVDRVHDAILLLLGSAQTSLAISMFGFDDPQFADVIKAKLQDPGVFVQLSLDKTQAGGVHERQILAAEAYPNTSIAIGTSESHHAIMHMKRVVVDGRFVIGGSTNWSASGETWQDNELTVLDSVPEAKRATARIAAIHASMLARTAKGA